MHRRWGPLLAALAAVAALLAGPGLPGPAATVVLGHANFVASSPAPGEVVPTSPATLTISFSEPFEPAFSNVDLLDGEGVTLLEHFGRPDPTDPRVLVVDLPSLKDGVYTVEWRTVSATDGHSANGFFTFGVGDVAPPPGAGGGAGSGDIHAGHGQGVILLETEGRLLGDLGALLAVGLAIAALIVLRSPWPRRGIAAALVIGAVGTVTLAAASAASAGGPPQDLLLGTRTGQLLLVRVAVAVTGLIAMLAAARLGRPRLAVAAGAATGLAGIALIAESGHASGFDSPAPFAAALVHLVAAGAWLGGLAVLVVLALRTDDRWSLRDIVPRFSAVALVSIGLVVATGLYADWLLTGAPLRFDTPYAVALGVKIILVLAALGIGALNYLDSGRGQPWLGGFPVRIVTETGLALAVLVAAATVASGAPPGLAEPTPITPAFSSAAAADATLALEPGRPGPASYLVTLPTAPPSAELVLTRLDAGSGSTRLPLMADPAVTGSRPGYRSDGGSIPAGSRWDATVVVHDTAGTETGRTRFVFAMGPEAVTEGVAEPAIDLGRLIGLALILAGALLLAFTLAGGTLPRVERRAGRLVAVTGSLIAAALGVLMLVGGG